MTSSRADYSRVGHLARVADVIIDEFWSAGIRRLYGMPGGGSNMTLIDAAAKRGLEFILAHHEPAAVFMAAGEAEISGIPGVCLATLGPGVANSINGLAHCMLDQVPLILVTDRAENDLYRHQLIDHSRLVQAAVKASLQIEPNAVRHMVRSALSMALKIPQGPIHLDLTKDVALALGGETSLPPSRGSSDTLIETDALDAATDLLRRSRRPAALVGLGGRSPEVVRALRSFVTEFGIPVLTTYKAKGVIPENSRLSGGLVTNGALEGRLLQHADALLSVGFDSVELMPGKWRWSLPTVTIGHEVESSPVIPSSVQLSGNPAAHLDKLEAKLSAARWKADWTSDLPLARPTSAEVTKKQAAAGVEPIAIARIARRLTPEGTIATVDAGSHMFAATLFWYTERPRRFLISNGLSTMGYGLPAAIGASFVCPGELVVCFTGDGGLAMAVGELETAARTRARVIVLVFNDQALNLIKIKQEKSAGTTLGLDFGAIDWASVARGMGVDACRVEDDNELEEALANAIANSGPTLIDVKLDPSSYPAMLDVIRG